MNNPTLCKRCGAHTEQGPVDFCNACYGGYIRERDLLENAYNPNKNMIQGICLLLKGLQETYPKLDVQNQHFEQTPHRVARMFTEICWGLEVDETSLLSTSFEEDTYGGIVAVTNIGFTSLCKHHFAIFRGIAHVAYIPDGKLVGLSKINRVVEAIAARPQVQEHITYQIAEAIEQTLRPKGVAVILEGSHDCIEVRGVRSKGSVTKTAEMRGVFLTNAMNCKDEFMSIIGKQ